MTGGLSELTLAMAVFVAAHIIPSLRTLRRALIGGLGEWPFRAVYSTLSIGLLWWLIGAYQRAPHIELFAPITFLKYLPIAFMLPACLLVVGGISVAGSPAALGILKITRHPMLWAMAIWGVAHMAANPDGAAWIMFGSLTALSVAGSIHMDRRESTDGGAEWLALQAATSNIPFVALIAGRTRLTLAGIGWPRIAGGVVLYVALLTAHPYVIGVSPVPPP